MRVPLKFSVEAVAAAKEENNEESFCISDQADWLAERSCLQRKPANWDPSVSVARFSAKREKGVVRW